MSKIDKIRDILNSKNIDESYKLFIHGWSDTNENNLDEHFRDHFYYEYVDSEEWEANEPYHPTKWYENNDGECLFYYITENDGKNGLIFFGSDPDNCDPAVNLACLQTYLQYCDLDYNINFVFVQNIGFRERFLYSGLITKECILWI